MYILNLFLELAHNSFAGDIRKRGVTHKCQGCCSGAADAAHKIQSLLFDAFFDGLNVTPSTIKWYTFERSMVSQTALMLIHSIGMDVCEDTFHQAVLLNDEVGDDDNFHLYCRKKIQQARLLVMDALLCARDTYSCNCIHFLVDHGL